MFHLITDHYWIWLLLASLGDTHLESIVTIDTLSWILGLCDFWNLTFDQLPISYRKKKSITDYQAISYCDIQKNVQITLNKSRACIEKIPDQSAEFLTISCKENFGKPRNFR